MNPCAVPGCKPQESSRCLVWGGRRLCYQHFDAFFKHELSYACDKRQAGPTELEWAEFVSSLRSVAA